MENTMTNIETQSPVILTGRKLYAAKWGWSALFVIYTIFRGFNVLDNLTGKESIYFIVMEILTYIITTGLALVLFTKKTGVGIAIYAATMLVTYGTSGFYFFKWAFNVNLEINGYTSQHLLIDILDTYTLFFSLISLIGFFLSFPNGRWLSSWAKNMFWGAVIFSITCATMLPFLFLLNPRELTASIIEALQAAMMFFAAFGCGTMLFVHYRKMKISIQRQQIKWVIVFFVSGAAVVVFLAVAYFMWMGMELIRLPFSRLDAGYYFFYIYSTLLYVLYALELGMFSSLFIAIFRYRLWDVEIFINRAAVYSVLTGLLGILGAISLAVINYFIRQLFGEDSSVWAVVISVLPVATAFNPLRDRVQEVVDRYFKPEEVNFENHFLEFRADLRDMLGTSRIIEIVSKQVKKQLDVDFARIYLADENYKIPSLAVSDDTLKILISGKLVSREDNAGFSLIVPLVVTRPVFPDFIGVIVLGRRLNGRGYSTPMLDSLKLLGVNAGEAIYLSQLKEQAKITTPQS